MSNAGEWIDFEELCRRVPQKSKTTLRRYIAQHMISHRQLVRRGRLEFNWKTVERELRCLESPGINADLAAAALDAAPPGPPGDINRQLAELRDMVQAIARKVGVS